VEADIAELLSKRNALAAKGEALRTRGNDAKAATVALIDDIVRAVGGWVPRADGGREPRLPRPHQHTHHLLPREYAPPPLPRSPAPQKRLESQISSVTADVDTKRGQLVSSPSRIRDELDAAARSAEAASADLAAAEDERRSLFRRLEVARKAEKDVGKALGLLAELEVRRVEQYRARR
jgi:hypothetical protein